MIGRQVLHSLVPPYPQSPIHTLYSHCLLLQLLDHIGKRFYAIDESRSGRTPKAGSGRTGAAQLK